MPTITIDKQNYDADTLPEAVKQQLLNLRLVDQEIAHLQRQIGLAQAARQVFLGGLRANLPSPLEQALATETLQFN